MSADTKIICEECLRVIQVLESTRMPKSFNYDHVFGSNDTQEADLSWGSLIS